MVVTTARLIRSLTIRNEVVDHLVQDEVQALVLSAPGPLDKALRLVPRGDVRIHGQIRGPDGEQPPQAEVAEEVAQFRPVIRLAQLPTSQRLWKNYVRTSRIMHHLTYVSSRASGLLCPRRSV